MKIEKAEWLCEGDNIRITVPLQKVDKQRRIVSGFATVEVDDKHGDVVTKDASDAAFADFVGNVRLMHQPIPAGKVVSYRPEKYYDKKTGKFYDGIYVDAYISKGAENVWEMVNDGTLTGFSIGGDNVVAETRFNKDAGKPLRYITSYRMHELSLVDNPANQFSNIVSIQKLADGTETVEGTITKTNVENVFYCKKGHEPVALVGPEESKTCIDCNSKMNNIGWFDGDGTDKTEKVNALIEKFEADSTEGGEIMSKEENKEVAAPEEVETGVDANTTVESTEEVSPKGEDDVVAPEEETEESDSATNVEDANVSVTGTGEKQVEEAKQVVEPEFEDGKTVDGSDAVTKLLSELKTSLDSNSEKVATSVEKIATDVAAKFAELAETHSELEKKFGALSTKLAEQESRLEQLGKTGAIKKSADLGGSEETTLTKSDSKWGGIFSPLP